MNDWHWHDWGMHGIGWIIWTVPLIFFIWFIFRISQNSITNKQEDSALEILRKRYARGEISKEEFEEAKKTLM